MVPGGTFVRIDIEGLELICFLGRDRIRLWEDGILESNITGVFRGFCSLTRITTTKYRTRKEVTSSQYPKSRRRISFHYLYFLLWLLTAGLWLLKTLGPRGIRFLQAHPRPAGRLPPASRTTLWDPSTGHNSTGRPVSDRPVWPPRSCRPYAGPPLGYKGPCLRH